MEKPMNDRIQHITNNLLPATAFEGKYGPPQTLSDRLAYYHTPGASITVIDNFEVDWAQGFGICDARFKKKVTAETLFQAGSISKPVFALGVMRLVQEGRVSLDEDIQSYLSTWRVPSNAGWQPKINLRQLLSHTAGLTVHGFPGYQAEEPMPTVLQILNGEPPANTAKVEVNILPGMQFRYSGGGITVAQQALVDLLQQPFPQMMHELVFERLGLTNSSYTQPLPKDWAKRAATAHPWKGIPLKGKFHTYPEMAAAGLWTTATDLAKIGIELLKVLQDQKANALLTKETIESMLSPQLEGQIVGEGDFFGLGFRCSGKDDDFYFGHGGWDEGFVAQIHFYKNLGKGVVVMLNSNEGFPLLDEIIRAVAQEYEWPDTWPKEKTEIHLAHMDDYTGLYSSKAGQFRVSTAGDHLVFQYGQQPPLSIFPSSEVEFFTKAVNTNIRFEKDAKTNIVSLIIRQEDNQINADKL
jgi:CubicO group peptidase (beta-lactamase class C family)